MRAVRDAELAGIVKRSGLLVLLVCPAHPVKTEFGDMGIAATRKDSPATYQPAVH
jgi:hypothetical protein